VLRRISAASTVLVLLALLTAADAPAATLGPSLRAKLDGLGADAQVGTVIVSFNTTRGPQPASLDALRAVGITKGIALDRGLLQAFFTPEQGPFDFQPVLKARVKSNEATTRAFMAYALDNFRRRFAAGS
jgi:hypothetical protein